MDNTVPNNHMSSDNIISEILELPYTLFGDILTESFGQVVPEEVSSLSILVPTFSNNELYLMGVGQGVETNEYNYTDLTNSNVHANVTENTPQSIDQNNTNNQNVSHGVIVDDSNAYPIKLMEAENECKALEEISQKLKNEYLNLKQENDEIKRDIIKYLKTNKITFDESVIEEAKMRKPSSKSTATFSTFSTLESTKKSRGRPHKDLNIALKEFEELKSKLDKNERRVKSNNVASIKARENKKKRLEKLFTEEEQLNKLNKVLIKKYRRNKKKIRRMMITAIKSLKKT